MMIARNRKQGRYTLDISEDQFKIIVAALRDAAIAAKKIWHMDEYSNDCLQLRFDLTSERYEIT